MNRIEKTVFISYRRRIDVAWALAIFQNLTHHGYDCFLDFEGLASDAFEPVILENIKARAHFLILLSPSALERCSAPDDWLRREIESAITTKRNIVPLMMEGFDFYTPDINSSLTGLLAVLKDYNGLRVQADYFKEAMNRLREKYLNVPLHTVPFPTSHIAEQAAINQQSEAHSAPPVQGIELKAEEWCDQGRAAADSKDDAEAVRCFRRAVEAGNARGMTYLGVMYEQGRGGLPKDEWLAVIWFRKAANAGDTRGMANLGVAYVNGRGGLPKDESEAVNWFRKAAEGDDMRGMANLGVAYVNGRGGLPKDESQGVDWLRKAAERGSALGMANLGLAYVQGQGGLPKDEWQAVSWYLKAAEAGEPLGMSNLGVMYEQGRGGLSKDESLAVNWYRKAAEAGGAHGMACLGLAYESGRGGLSRDKSQALSWYRKAAEAGDELAQSRIEHLKVE